MKYYTGVGSRNTPVEICELMRLYSYRLADCGYIGRSGSANGADMAFESGFIWRQATSEIPIKSTFEAYIPWAGFNDRLDDGRHFVAPTFDNFHEAMSIARTVHPKYDSLKRGAQLLHGRNVYQVLGMDLKTPSDFVILYAPVLDANNVKGGTNTAYKLAKRNKIPVFNLFIEEDVQRLENFVYNIEGETFGWSES